MSTHQFESHLMMDSPVSDELYMRLIRELEKCSETGDCDTCPLFEPCLQLFDKLATEKRHTKLTKVEYDQFMAGFKALKKQLALC